MEDDIKNTSTKLNTPDWRTLTPSRQKGRRHHRQWADP